MSIKTYQLSFRVHFWFICVFHPVLGKIFPFLFLFLSYPYFGTFGPFPRDIHIQYIHSTDLWVKNYFSFSSELFKKCISQLDQLLVRYVSNPSKLRVSGF